MEKCTMKILSKARYAVSIFFAAAILLTSCGANDSYDDTTRVVTTYKNIYDIGEFATNSAGGLFFGDFDTLETVYVCSKPNCTHSDETCSAYGFNIVPTTPFVYHGDNLYWFTLEHIYNDDNMLTTDCKLHKCDLDGTNRVTVASLSEGLGVNCVHLVLDGDVMYFIVSPDRSMNKSDQIPVYLYSYTFSENKVEQIMQICEGYSSYAEPRGIFDGKLYLVYAEYDWPLSTIVADGGDQADYRHEVTIDLETLEMEEAEKAPIGISDGVLLSIDDSGVQITEPDGSVYMATEFEPQEWYGYDVVNGMLICQMMGTAYDYKNDKYYTVNSGGKTVVDWRNGKYILRAQDENLWYTYSAADADEIFIPQ